MDHLTVDDSFSVEPARECGNVTLPSVKTVTFEVPWAEMLRALPAGTRFGNGVARADVSEWIGHIRIYVFSDIQAERFMCPSGVDVALDSKDAVEQRLAKISVYEDALSSMSVGLRE